MGVPSPGYLRQAKINLLRKQCPAKYLNEFDSLANMGWKGARTVDLCRFCKRPCLSFNSKPDPECDGCHEVTVRIESFLRDGGAHAREFVFDKLVTSMPEVNEGLHDVIHGMQKAAGYFQERMTDFIEEFRKAFKGDRK